MWYTVPALERLRTGVYILQKGIPMVMQRWGSVLLMLMVVLAACGTADTSDIALSDTGVEPSATADGAYPTPQNAAPTATHAPTQEATSAPTSEGTEEVLVEPLEPTNNLTNTPLAFTLTHTVTISIADDRSTTSIIGWSPDGTKVLYATHRTLTETLYVLDLHSGETWRLTENALTTEYDADHSRIVHLYNPPIWQDNCCHVLVPILAPAEQQALTIFSLEEHDTEQIGLFARGKFTQATSKEIHLLQPDKLSTIEKNSIQASELENTLARNTYMYAALSQDGQLAFIHHPHTLIIKDIPNELHSIDIESLSLKSQQKERLETLAFDRPQYIPGTEMISFLIRGNRGSSLWTSNLQTPPQEQLYITGEPMHYAWSNKGHLVSWEKAINRAGRNIYVSNMHSTEVLVHAGADSNALWHPQKSMLITSSLSGDMLDPETERIFYIYELVE